VPSGRDRFAGEILQGGQISAAAVNDRLLQLRRQKLERYWSGLDSGTNKEGGDFEIVGIDDRELN